MKSEPSPLITRFIAAMNARDIALFLDCFSPEAIVHDEGHTHQGQAQIQAWIEKAWAAYGPQIELQTVHATGPDTLFAGEVSGSFPGSPVVLQHHLTVANDRIVELKIAP